MQKTRKNASAPQPKEVLQRLCGGRLGSLGDFERLAGIDTCNAQERIQLWSQFRPLYALSFQGSHQPLFDAVTNYCATVAMQRVERGELCLLPASY